MEADGRLTTPPSGNKRLPTPVVTGRNSIVCSTRSFLCLRLQAGEVLPLLYQTRPLWRRVCFVTLVHIPSDPHAPASARPVRASDEQSQESLARGPTQPNGEVGVNMHPLLLLAIPWWLPVPPPLPAVRGQRSPGMQVANSVLREEGRECIMDSGMPDYPTWTLCYFARSCYSLYELGCMVVVL